MRIAVLIKRVPDTASVLKITDSTKSVVTHGLKFVMGPYDEHAVEEAVQIKESTGAKVVVISLGTEDAKETIRTAFAMGSDEGILVKDADAESRSSRGTAKALAAVLKNVEADVILAGKQAVDDDASQVPERVAEILGLPHTSVVTRLQVGDRWATVVREVDGGHWTLELPLPAVLTVQKGINTPRYPTLPNIMRAKRMAITEVELGSLGLSPEDLRAGIEVESLSLPRQERLKRILEGESGAQVAELTRLLREEEQVL